MSCHDDDLTRHNTRPQVAAKCKNGENCFGIGRTDHYLSFKKNFAGKSILVSENEPDLQRSSIWSSKILDFFRSWKSSKIMTQKVAKMEVFRDFSKVGARYGFFRIFPIWVVLVRITCENFTRRTISYEPLEFSGGTVVPPPRILYRLSINFIWFLDWSPISQLVNLRDARLGVAIIFFANRWWQPINFSSITALERRRYAILEKN